MSQIIRIVIVFILYAVNSTLASGSVTINLNNEKQAIRGFGGMLHIGWQGYDLNSSDRELAFGNNSGQIGLTVLRIPIYDNENDWGKELESAKNVISHGGIVYASPWSPPASLRTSYSFNRWGTIYNSYKIDASNYSAYAEHLNKFAKYMKDNGAPLYAISMQNEPDWCDSWTCWSEDEVYNFIKTTGNSLRQHGTKVITAESFAYNKSYYDKLLNDPDALEKFDIIGAHFYGSDSKSSDTFFQYPLADQKATNKERWMTEHYADSKGNGNLWKGYIITGDQDQTPKYDSVKALDVAYEIHRSLVEGNFNQYTWWYIRRNYGLIMHDATNNVKPAPIAADAGKVSKRGYCMAQYARFVRPGAVRVEATKNPDKNVYVSAFKKADSVVIVAVNRSSQNTIDFFVPIESSITSWEKYTTSLTKNVNDDGTITPNNGNFSSDLDEESVTTFVGVISDFTSSSSSTNTSSSSSIIYQSPYSSSPMTIPGIIESENYDLGGEGIAFHDIDAINQGGEYRNDGIDIVTTNDGYALGYTEPGEWLEYSIDILGQTEYLWEARVASGNDNSAFHLEINSIDITGTVSIPNTGDWDTYTTLNGTTKELANGNQTLKIAIDSSYCNIDWIRFSEKTVPLLIEQDKTKNQKYKVFSLLGAYIGMVYSNSKDDIHIDIKNQIPQSGVYIIKPMHHENSFLLPINK